MCFSSLQRFGIAMLTLRGWRCCVSFGLQTFSFEPNALCYASTRNNKKGKHMLNKKAIAAFSFGAAFVAGLAFATPAMAADAAKEAPAPTAAAPAPTAAPVAPAPTAAPVAPAPATAENDVVLDDEGVSLAGDNVAETEAEGDTTETAAEDDAVAAESDVNLSDSDDVLDGFDDFGDLNLDDLFGDLNFDDLGDFGEADFGEGELGDVSEVGDEDLGVDFADFGDLGDFDFGDFAVDDFDTDVEPEQEAPVNPTPAEPKQETPAKPKQEAPAEPKTKPAEDQQAENDGSDNYEDGVELSAAEKAKKAQELETQIAAAKANVSSSALALYDAYDAEAQKAAKQSNLVKETFTDYLKDYIANHKLSGDDLRDAQDALAIMQGKTIKGYKIVVDKHCDDNGCHWSEGNVPAEPSPDFYHQARNARPLSAASLLEIHNVANYYDRLNDFRKQEGLHPVNVSLRSIAEAITHSMFSDTVFGHAMAKVPEQHPYAMNVAENLAWGNYRDSENNSQGDDKTNPMYGWYNKEKEIFDNVAAGKDSHFVLKSGANLEQYRHDFSALESLTESLFEDDADGSKMAEFDGKAGHYLNFMSVESTVGGFAQTNDAAIYGATTVWHAGINKHTSLTPSEFVKSFNEYVNKVTAGGKTIKPDNLEALYKTSFSLGQAMVNDSALTTYVQLQKQLQDLGVK